jgi:dephospho-CoA kinase
VFNVLTSPVFDADATVHMLYSTGGRAVAPIRDRFPGAVVDNKVDRAALGGYVLSDVSALTELEGIIHPLVAEERCHFFESACSRGCLAVVYDIPLLFENRDKHSIDYSLVVTASSDTQRSRVLARPGMTPDKFEAILQKQLPDAAKREMADFVISTDYRGYAQVIYIGGSGVCDDIRWCILGHA